MASLQIQSYGISITTLEEVFLKVGHLTDPSKAIQDENDEKADADGFDPTNPMGRQFSHRVMRDEADNFEKKMDEFLLGNGHDETQTS